MLYAAYGSNLNPDDLAVWCRESGREVALGAPALVGYIPDRRPAFTIYAERRRGGALDIVPELGAVTPCAAYDVDEEALAALDLKEGCPGGYERVQVTVLAPDLVAAPAVGYAVAPTCRQQHVRPSTAYVDAVCGGLRLVGHSTEILDAAVDQRSDPALVRSFFFYGTLMRGEPRESAPRRYGVRREEAATVAGGLRDLVDYPALVPASSPTERVHGELVELEEVAPALRELDAIEGFFGFGCRPSLFERRLVMAETEGGERRLAWTYLFAGSAAGRPVIEGGDWRRRGARRGS